MFHRKKILFEVSVPVDKASYLIIPRLCEGGKIRAILGERIGGFVQIGTPDRIRTCDILLINRNFCQDPLKADALIH